MSTFAPPRPVRAAPVAPPAPRPDAPPRRPGVLALSRRQRTVVTGLRFTAFTLLSFYGLLHWARQIAPTSDRVAIQLGLTATLTAVVLLALRGVRPDRVRRALTILAGVLAALVTVTASGVPVRLESYRHWGELSSGVGQGLQALPDLNIPYRGLDEWVRIVVMLGGGLLALIAALLAFGTRKPRNLAAAVALGGIYGVAVVERNPDRPFLSGAGFALALALWLGAERLVAARGAVPKLAAVALALSTVGVGLLLAPSLDAKRPWLDYRGIASDLAQRKQTAFDWNHSYGPLHWPRDGRELLRIKSNVPTYWKAEVLTRFDGLRWINQTPADPYARDTPLPSNRQQWYQDIQVDVRGLRSEQYISAGFTRSLGLTPNAPTAAGYGTFDASTRDLKSGDTYTASVYAPHPDVPQLKAAGSDYPPSVTGDELAIDLPAAEGGPTDVENLDNVPAVARSSAEILFPAWGTTRGLEILKPGQGPYEAPNDAVMQASAYQRTWALAQQLKAVSSSPYDFVRRVRARVMAGASYTEDPTQAKVPLDGFLFDTHQGYCQQFSGAMALLLRMGGVPARIATGFAPGSFDPDHGQYVVRDLDAHSWVEVYFPTIGWVTFDPTPAQAPPRDQSSPDDQDAASSSSSADKDAAAALTKRDPTFKPGAGAAGGAQHHGASRWLLIGGAALLLGIGALVRLLVRLGRPVAPLDELREALARSGRPPAPGQTLQGLEFAMRDAPAAQSYVRALRLARYAPAAQPPDAAARTALRRELAEGLGLRGRLRAWLALPPHRRAV